MNREALEFLTQFSNTNRLAGDSLTAIGGEDGV